MQVLIRLAPGDRSPSDTPDALAGRIFETVRGLYDETASDGEAYLQEPDGPNGLAEELELVDGRSDPDAIIDMAENWNAGLAADFQAALSDVQAHAGTEDGAGRWLDVPSQKVYELKKAVMALDDSFYDFAEKLLLVSRDRYFTTRIKADELACVKAGPENYAAITVYPK